MKTKLLKYVAVTALSISGITMLSTYADNNGNPWPQDAKAESVTPITNNADKHDLRQIQRTLSRVVSDAASKGDLDDVIGYLSKSSRQNIGKLHYDQMKDLDARIDEFQNNWHQKFNENFGMGYYRDILNYIAVQTDGKTRATVMLSDQPFNGMAQNEDNNNAANNNNANPGVAGNVANAVANGVNNALGHQRFVTLTLENEGTIMNEWRIDTSLQSADQLKQNLIQTFDHLNRDKDSWPTDKTEAYRIVSVRILQSIAAPNGAENNGPTANGR